MQWVAKKDGIWGEGALSMNKILRPHVELMLRKSCCFAFLARDFSVGHLGPIPTAPVPTSAPGSFYRGEPPVNGPDEVSFGLLSDRQVD